MNWFKEASNDVVKKLNSDVNSGLNDERIKLAKAQFGLNQIMAQKSISPIWMFLLHADSSNNRNF